MYNGAVMRALASPSSPWWKSSWRLAPEFSSRASSRNAVVPTPPSAKRPSEAARGRSPRAVSIALLLLTGCPSTDAPPDRPPKSSSKSKPTPVPTTDRHPESFPATNEPPAKPLASQWWCACYQSDTPAGPEATTSCRELESECRALERRIAKGGRGLITGSVSVGCRVAQGEHPGDSLGGRERWKPSARAGAWTSDGVCLLEASAVTDELVEDNHHTEERDAEEDDLLASESFGQLRLNMSAAQIEALLGEPQAKSAFEESAATGEFTQEWAYPDAGLTLTMSAKSRHGALSLGHLHAKFPSTSLTARKIGIGSTWDAVNAAYGDVHDDAGLDPADKSVFTAGSVYGGVLFSFEAGKVASIFMGAAAE